MDVAKTDLNLLRVFDALMEDCHVTRAGFRLGVSQPAMSHALAKLRSLTGDPLFVRIPAGMKPTDYALRIAPSVREGLRLLAVALQGANNFDPGTSDRTFHILMSDIGELAYLPVLLQRLANVAPLVNIRVLQVPRESYADVFLSGEADLAVGVLPALRAGFYQVRLFADRYVCLVRKEHPRIKERITVPQLIAESHVIVEPGGSRYSTTAHQTSSSTWMEQYFARKGLVRRVAVRVPHFTVVPDIVQSTDLIAMVPSHVIRHTHPRAALKAMQLPMQVPAFTVKLYWHERNHEDPAVRWLRGLITELFGPAPPETSVGGACAA